jgi:hypothetical protein
MGIWDFEAMRADLISEVRVMMRMKSCPRRWGARLLCHAMLRNIHTCYTTLHYEYTTLHYTTLHYCTVIER